MVYPNFVATAYRDALQAGRFTDVEKTQLYEDFVTHYLNLNIFTSIGNGRYYWYNWHPSRTVDYEDRKIIIAVFNLTPPQFLIPHVKDIAANHGFLNLFTEVVLNTYPLYEKNSQKVTAEASETLKQKNEIAFTPPTLSDGSAVPNYLVHWLKDLATPQFFSVPVTSGRKNNFFLKSLEKSKESSEKYGYPAFKEPKDLLGKMALYPLVYFEIFFSNHKKFFTLHSFTIKNMVKFQFAPLWRDRKLMLTGIGASYAVVNVATYTFFPDFVFGLTLGYLMFFMTYFVIRPLHKFGQGWVSLTPYGEKLLQEALAWENYVNNSSPEQTSQYVSAYTTSDLEQK